MNRSLIVAAQDPTTSQQVRQALEHYFQIWGPDKLTAGYLNILGSIRDQSEPQERTTLDSSAPALLTRREVAAMAGVSVSTVSRWKLPKIGRRYPAEAVRQHLAERTNT